MVERRDVVTLLPIIARCVRIGTEVHSDDWAAYRQMDHHIHSVSHHQAVVERLHLVDPVTGIHTQEVESCRNNLKLGQKIRRGIGRGGHAVLPGREDVASVESREPSECHE